MKTLFLSGHGIDLHVDSGRLLVRDGRDYSKKPTAYEFKAKHDDLDLIVIYGHTGNVNLDIYEMVVQTEYRNDDP